MGGADGSTPLSGKAMGGAQLGRTLAASGDLDGDSHPDLLWQQDGSRALTAWYMGGADAHKPLEIAARLAQPSASESGRTHAKRATVKVSETQAGGHDRTRAR